MNFDIRTLSIITAVSSLVFAFSSIAVARLLPGERHLRDWAIGSALTAASTFLVGMRGVIPDMVSAAVANTLLTLGLIFMFIGSRGMVRRSRPSSAVWLFAVFAFVGLSWYTVVQPNLLARVILVSVVAAPLLALTGLEFWRHDRLIGPSPLRQANRLTSLVYLSGVGIFVARLGPALNSQDVETYLHSTGALFVAPYFWAILFNVWLAIMVTLSASARLQADLAKARDQAQASSLAKSQFLANMSHEIRTPMNAILGMLKLLQGTELSPRQQDYTNKTEGAARSLLGLLNDILDFSKVEAGKMSIDALPFSVERMLRELAVVLSANVGSKNISVLFDVDPAIAPVLVGDAMRLHQVLVNLGGNAIKFTAQGQVVLSLRQKQLVAGVASIEFTVDDSGIGISLENQGHIFSGFSQAESSTTRRFGGTGLGLAISQRLVELMGGGLQLSSVLGQGSSFSFTLEMPVANPAALDGVPTPPKAGPHLSVLIIDGNPVAVTTLAAMTQSWAWPTQTAGSGEHALELIRSQAETGQFPFQVIFLDWRLPGIDGWETMRQIHNVCESCAGLQPIMVMVASYNRSALDQRPAQEQTMLHAFLPKPVTASMLLEAVMQPVASDNALRKSARASKLRRLEGMRLLVVEDNLINQQVAQELLRSEGAQVALAANGQLGVDAVASAQPPYDAVLMDIQMPVLDGYGATRLIRQQLGMTKLPILAMTANAMPSDRQACIDAGMNEHIGKPFDLTHLVQILQQLVKRNPLPSRSDAMPVALAAPAPLLDMAAALARMGGAKDLYLRALHDFDNSLTTSVSEFRRLAPVDAHAAAMHMHSLKGASATVGAAQLSRIASQLEALCASPAGPGSALNQLVQLQGIVQLTQSSIRGAIETLGKP